MYYVYIVKCEGGQLYTGIAADIARRMREHFSQSGKCAKFTRSHKISSLEALWMADSKGSALKLECRIKKLARSRKLELIAAPERAEELCPGGSFIPVSGFSLAEMLDNLEK